MVATKCKVFDRIRIGITIGELNKRTRKAFEKGCVEGAIKELERIQEISFKDNLNKEQTLCEILQYIGKRLKNLEKVGEQK